MRSDRAQRGFTVAELAVSLLVTIVLILGVLSLFDFSSRLSRVQTNVADMQQSLRVSLQDTVRMVRMAGRGGLPLGSVPTGLAMAVRDNVAANTRIAGGSTPLIVEGTDAITVRGVFRNPIWQINSANPASFNLTTVAGAPVRGTVQIATSTPTGIPQDLSALRALVLNPVRVPEALILVSPRDATVYAVVELNAATSDVNTNPNLYTIGFTITGGTNTAQYLPLSSGGGWPVALTNVAFVGILEEFRYYVRDDAAGPRLSRAQAFPGTQLPWRNDNDASVTNDAHPNWSQDIADNILDLQIALGFDTPQGGGAMTDDDNGTGNDDRIFEAADGQNDDWLYNDTQAFNAATWNGPPLYFIRFSILARTDRRDPQFQAPLLAWIEDHNLSLSKYNLRNERMYRRRVLETLIDVRNLG
ncbi:MAG: PilW family protein [Acidobacteriota bacterium]